jgi:penicillin amidase
MEVTLPVTANNKVISDDYPYHISHDRAQPYRQMRIQEYISAMDNITVEDMQALQMDQMNQVLEALSILGKWNFVDEVDGSAPLIFNLWMGEIQDVLFEEEIPVETLELFGGKRQTIDELLRRALEGKPGPWIEEHGGLQNVLEVSLQRVLEELEDSYGTNMEKWK